MKRAWEEDSCSEKRAKVRRVLSTDSFSNLSDELLVRILSFAPVSTLLVCQRVSKKLGRLAVDSELWKAAYYKQFVLPRATRIPGIKDRRAASDHLRYSSKLSKWLDDGHLIRNGPGTDWKQQYRLRHNWSQGQCGAVSEIVVAERPPDPPLLVMMSNSTIYTADSISGLRAFSTRAEHELIALTPLLQSDTDTLCLPTSMAIDAHLKSTGHERVVIGFANGSFKIYELRKEAKTFKTLFEHPSSTNGMLSAIAYSAGYLLTMTESQLLSVYIFLDDGSDDALDTPRLLYSLQSHTVWPPVSLSIRSSTTSMTAAIAYALPTYLSGWTVGIQEMRISHNGELLESRLATATDDHYHKLSGQRSMSSSTTRSSSPFPGGSRGPLRGTAGNSKPTSLSYSHPYLLAAHPDNTLSLYLVKSTSSSLSISPGTRLWGHTSSVSGAYVGMRGKAVSVSRLGDELRVWDLEGGMNSSANQRRSVRVQPSRGTDSPSSIADDEPLQKIGLRYALDQSFDDATVSRGWVGFDEQSVIVLREKSEGSQALVVYDFT